MQGIMKSNQYGVIVGVLISCTLWTVVRSVYVYSGDPYHQTKAIGVGRLEFSKTADKVPIHTQVTYPIDPGEYVPILFVSGLNGVVYPEMYSTVTTRLASYGYLVAAPDLYWPAQGEDMLPQEVVGRNAELAFEVLQWLKVHLESHYLPSAGSPNVSVDWKKLGLLGHSLGGDTLIKMLEADSVFAQAVVYLEPGSSSFRAPLNYSIPSLSTGTQFCREFPVCCEKGLSYDHFYTNMPCPKIVLNITGVGHCSIIDEVAWDLCHLSHFCKTEKTAPRTVYRDQFMPGLLASFYGTYLQGNQGLSKYATTPTLMPLTVNYLKTDLNCN